MKTIVYQSFRTENVPEWMRLCLQSVPAWAEAQGYDYAFHDDSFFDQLPDWYREKAAGTDYPMWLWSDLARLLQARHYLQNGYERAVWVDADLLVFDEKHFLLPDVPLAFCREVFIWPLDPDPRKRIPSALKTFLRDVRAGQPFAGSMDPAQYSVNNAVFACTRERLGFLDFYIRGAELIVKDTSQERLSGLAVGTGFLKFLPHFYAFEQLRNVASPGPFVLHDLLAGGGPYLRRHAKAIDVPLGAANLALSHVGKPVPEAIKGKPFAFDGAFMCTVVNHLRETRGALLNAHLKG